MSNPFANTSPPPVFGQPATGYEQPSSLVPLDDDEVRAGGPLDKPSGALDARLHHRRRSRP